MTTKKFAKYVRKQCRKIAKFSLVPIFEEYIANVNGKRVGIVHKDKFYVIYAPTFERFKKVMPDAVPVNPFEWGYYHLVEIENLEDVKNLKEIISAVYDDLYFDDEFVIDIASLFYAYKDFPDLVESTYDLHITFLRFCYEKKLIHTNWIDDKDRILKFYFKNEDLTEDGHKIFLELYEKWITYNNKNDPRAKIRTKDVTKLEKYYQGLIKNTIFNVE